jgi:hypothetical protein
MDFWWSQALPRERISIPRPHRLPDLVTGKH